MIQHLVTITPLSLWVDGVRSLDDRLVHGGRDLPQCSAVQLPSPAYAETPLCDFQFSSRCTCAPLWVQKRPLQAQESGNLSSVPQDFLCYFCRLLLYDRSLVAAVTSLSHRCCVFTLASAMAKMLKKARAFTFPICVTLHSDAHLAGMTDASRATVRPALSQRAPALGHCCLALLCHAC